VEGRALAYALEIEDGDPRRIRERRLAPDGGVDGADGDGQGADADGERRDDGQGEAGRPREGAEERQERTRVGRGRL